MLGNSRSRELKRKAGGFIYSEGAADLIGLLVDGKKRTVAYKEWAGLLKANFETYYYVPSGNSFDFR